MTEFEPQKERKIRGKGKYITLEFSLKTEMDLNLQKSHRDTAPPNEQNINKVNIITSILLLIIYNYLYLPHRSLPTSQVQWDYGNFNFEEYSKAEGSGERKLKVGK